MGLWQSAHPQNYYFPSLLATQNFLAPLEDCQILQ